MFLNCYCKIRGRGKFNNYCFGLGSFLCFYISFNSCRQGTMEQTCFCSQMEKNNLQKFSLDNIQKLRAFKFFLRQEAVLQKDKLQEPCKQTKIFKTNFFFEVCFDIVFIFTLSLLSVNSPNFTIWVLPLSHSTH